jgi:hypothetical protein
LQIEGVKDRVMEKIFHNNAIAALRLQDKVKHALAAQAQRTQKS